MLPEFEARYRTNRKAEMRAIAGYSLGGEIAMSIGLRHPELFRWIGSFSGSLFERDFAERYVPLVTTREQLEPLRLIFIGCGRGDLFLPDNLKFAELLKSNHVGHTMREVEGFHSMPAFRRQLVEFLPLLFGRRESKRN